MSRVGKAPNSGSVPGADESRVEVLAAGEHHVPENPTIAVVIVAGRVADESHGGARESGGGVRGRFGAVGFNAPRRVLRLGRVHAGHANGVASPIEPYADGVAVDDTVNLGRAGLCEGWRAGQPREDREGRDVRADATRP